MRFGVRRVALAVVLGALAAPAVAGADVLYDQTAGASTPNGSPAAPNFAPSNTVSSAGMDMVADDFTIPAGDSWKINQVDVTGAYMSSTGGVVKVTIFQDSGSTPGAVAFEESGINAATGPNYLIPVDGVPTLTQGRYWLSVQEESSTGVVWSWGTNPVQSGLAAKMRMNYTNGSCTTASLWYLRTQCWTGTDPDQAFKLSGTKTTTPIDPVGPPIVPGPGFTLGKVTLNKKKGTATQMVFVPAPGSLRITGRNIKAAEQDVSAAGDFSLPVKPKSRITRKLERAGKAKVKVSVVFTPTVGSVNSEDLTITLKRA